MGPYRWFLILVLALACVFAGCSNMPSGTKACLATATATLKVTVKDYDAANEPPWLVPADATVEQQAVIYKQQVDLLIFTVREANKSFDTVMEWAEANRNSPLPDKEAE